MTVEEAKQKLLSNGWPADKPFTAEALRFAGWEPGAILDGLPTPTTLYTPEQLRQGAAELLAEAQANQIPSVVLENLKKFIGVAVALRP